jgi:DNA excision repair protein ERCC-6
VQRVRNPNTDTSEKIKVLKSEMRVGLSGSPIQNNLRELWSIFDFIAPGRLGTLSTFEENLAWPVERGCRPNASAGAAQAAYRCALLIRDLTLPLMLRRLKTEVSEWLKLPGREEQVLFCHLSKEQFLLYREFIHTQIEKKFIRASERSHAFFCLSVLRKLSNHPDLLLDSREDVDDFGSPGRSGKLKVLLSLLRKWHSEGRRALVFSQTVSMLDVIEEMVAAEGFTSRRMDGSTPVSERDDVISDFALRGSQEETVPFCLLLTTRVGGVGLNLQGADRVVIFDPDWNPMIDAQARERAWRIGQERDVVIYRLVAAGTVEELIYRRQLHKHFLAQRILSDPRQQPSDLWMDLRTDLLRVPPPPPGLDESEIPNAKLVRAVKSAKADASAAAAEPVEVEDPAKRATELLSAVFDQKQVEQLSLSSAFVDPREADEAARKAILALGLDRDTPPDSNSGHWWITGAERSHQLIASIKRAAETPVEAEAAFQTEKDIAAGIRGVWSEDRREVD